MICVESKSWAVWCDPTEDEKPEKRYGKKLLQKDVRTLRVAQPATYSSDACPGVWLNSVFLYHGDGCLHVM